MAITINDTVESRDSKIVYFTIEYDGKDYKWHSKMKKDISDVQSYLDSRSDYLKEGILRQQYHKANVPKLVGKTELESFEKWVSDGCKNAGVKGADIEGNEYVIKAEETISKKTWVDTH